LRLLKRHQRRNDECQNGLLHGLILHCAIAARQKMIVAERNRVE
jgi:hypothetical protein